MLNTFSAINKALTVLLLGVLIISCTDPDSVGGSRYFEDKAREIYIINAQAETLSVYQPDTGTLYADVILTGNAPNDVIYHNDLLFIVNSLDNEIQVVDESTFEAVTEIYLGENRNPWTLIIDEAADKGYIPNFVADTVQVIDMTTYEILREIPVGNGPEGGFFTEGRVVVCNTNYQGTSTGYGAGSLSIIDTSDYSVETVSIDTSKGVNPQSAVYVSSSDEIHIALTGDYSDDAAGAVLVLDGTDYSEIALIETGGSPVLHDQYLRSDTLEALVPGYSGMMSYNYDTHALLHDSDDFLLTAFCSGLVYDDVNDFIMVTLFDDDSLVFLDPDDYSQIKELSVSDGPQSPRLITE